MTEYMKIINDNEAKGEQVRLVVSDFRDVTYFSLLKYYVSYEGEWCASKEGITIPLSFANVYKVLDGLLEICSDAEAKELISYYYKKVNRDGG